jgi:ribonuclease HI
MIVTIKCDGGGMKDGMYAVAAAIAFEGGPNSEARPLGGSFEFVAGTTNDAEITAIAVAFEYAITLFKNQYLLNRSINDLYVISDSDLAVNLTKGMYKCRKEKFKPIVDRVNSARNLILLNYPECTTSIGWHRRNKNTTADGLVNHIKKLVYTDNSRIAKEIARLSKNSLS